MTEESSKELYIHGRSLLSGLLGALASMMAKLAFGSQPDGFLSDGAVFDNLYLARIFPWLLRGIALLGMIGCNAAMLATFLDGMEESGSVAGTALSTAANFLASAILGFAVWNETSINWLGVGMVVAGATMVSSSRGPAPRTKASQKQD